jgi:tRNA dimethylallyltransferase
MAEMTERGRPRIVVLLGPTGVGKSKLAIELAEDFKGEIISADSMQVYRYMDIGTAKPTIDERRRVPHYLLDVVTPDHPFMPLIVR